MLRVLPRSWVSGTKRGQLLAVVLGGALLYAWISRDSNDAPPWKQRGLKPTKVCLPATAHASWCGEPSSLRFSFSSLVECTRTPANKVNNPTGGDGRSVSWPPTAVNRRSQRVRHDYLSIIAHKRWPERPACHDKNVAGLCIHIGMIVELVSSLRHSRPITVLLAPRKKIR